ncbi:MAG TPA: patatin-like phospholipase family protein [Candidatus Omnitrophota bacterium]|nr:patatin-like phospholipase family protein [Candidatus Omnitrophota bacterium]
MKRYIWLMVLCLIVCGCATGRHAVPATLLSDTRVLGLSDIRAFGGSPSDSFKKDFVRLLEQAEPGKPSFFDFGSTGTRTYSMIAISGGAANGAYGAGLLNGWSQHGSRPEFTVVTGISTGALIAPFAFLGREYDATLKEFYTRYSTKDIMRGRFPPGNSFASSRPMGRLIARYFDRELLAKIAAEYAKGRRLYVGTTNLDAQRLVIWDMGRIAALGTDEALALFRKILLASASIPIALPPVYLKVEAGGKWYDEMHVDGGVSKQLFFLYDVMQGFERAIKEKSIDLSRIKFSIYVIRNGYIDALWQEVPDNLVSIAKRTVDTMTNAQSVGDLFQVYAFTKLSKGDFNLAYIPATHIPQPRETFDPNEMRKLFDLGFAEAVQGYNWKKAPPGLEEMTGERK